MIAAYMIYCNIDKKKINLNAELLYTRMLVKCNLQSLTVIFCVFM